MRSQTAETTNGLAIQALTPVSTLFNDGIGELMKPSFATANSCSSSACSFLRLAYTSHSFLPLKKFS